MIGRIQLGDRFGRLTVKAPAGPYIVPSRGDKAKVWLCVCDCGIEKEVMDASLRSDNTKSCGCLERDRRDGYLTKLIRRFVSISSKERPACY